MIFVRGLNINYVWWLRLLSVWSVLIFLATANISTDKYKIDEYILWSNMRQQPTAYFIILAPWERGKDIKIAFRVIIILHIIMTMGGSLETEFNTNYWSISYSGMFTNPRHIRHPQYHENRLINKIHRSFYSV